jgi:hypothetical protein
MVWLEAEALWTGCGVIGPCCCSSWFNVVTLARQVDAAVDKLVSVCCSRSVAHAARFAVHGSWPCVASRECACWLAAKVAAEPSMHCCTCRLLTYSESTITVTWMQLSGASYQDNRLPA